MRTYAIIGAGTLVALSIAAVLWTTRYEVAQPFDPTLFRRYDRWTGRVEICSSMFDERTYCGPALKQRADEAVQADDATARKALLSYGFTEEEIDHWPKYVFEGARNAILNGGSKSSIDDWLKSNHVQ
jgi:hypothetical protein